MLMENKYVRKAIILVAALFVVSLVVAILVRLLEPSIAIKVESVPADIKISHNGKELEQKDKTIRLKKGVYDLKFSADGYKESTRNITISDNTTIDVALDPLTNTSYSSDKRSQEILYASDRQNGGLLSYENERIDTPDGEATLSRCRSLRYAGTYALCVSSPIPIRDRSLESVLQQKYNSSLNLYEIYYGYNYMMNVFDDDTLRVRYAYTFADSKPQIYIRTSLRSIDEIYGRLESIGVNRNAVYLSFENKELVQYNSAKSGGIDNHDGHGYELE